MEPRKDKFGVQFRERLKADIREAMVGAAQFKPKHAFVVTWKNVSFAGGLVPNALEIVSKVLIFW